MLKNLQLRHFSMKSNFIWHSAVEQLSK